MQLTNNYQCFVTKDREHFAIHNFESNHVDGGYMLGEYAVFEDLGVAYSVTVIKGKEVNNYTVDLKQK